MSPLRTALTVLLSLLTTGALTARDYHVSGTGSDAGDGSAAKPFREIRAAVAVLAPGDTVLIGDGEYLGFDVDKAGTAGKTTTFKATGKKAVVVPSKDRLLNDAHNIILTECTRVVLDGLRSFNAPTSGLRIYRCDRVTIRNGVFGDNGKWGIVTSHSPDLLIENNDCYGSKIEHGIYVANSGDRPVVRGNLIHGNAGSGLRSNGDIAEGGDGIISGAVYERNIIYGNGFSVTNGGSAINLDGLQDSVVRNNLLFDNHASGIALFKGCGAAGPKGMQILHNTVMMTADARYCLRITDATGPILVRNNLFYSPNRSRGLLSWDTAQDVAFTDSDYNLFSGALHVAPGQQVARVALDRWQTMGHEKHSLLRPRFESVLPKVNEGDYQLHKDSGAVDAGAKIEGGDLDLMGRPRVQGSAPDIGAVESAAR